MRNILFASTALALAMSGNAAWAQSGTDDVATEDQDQADNVIIVTARQRDESLLEIPLAVSVTSSCQW